jgi:hypothetical protein
LVGHVHAWHAAGQPAAELVVDRAAKRQDLQQLRIGLVVMTLFGLLPLVVTGFEFAPVNMF